MNPTYGSWVNVHEPKRPLEEEADEHADVFAAVCAIEEDRIKTHSRNLKGKFIMTVKNDQIETKLEEAIVHTRNQYGDPLSICSKHISVVSPDYYARVTNSMHWYSQMGVINAARSILFELYDENQTKSDETPAENLQAFCLDIHDVLAREDIWETNEVCKLAAEKYRLMLDWEKIAISAANANDRDYEPKTLTELLLAEKPAKVRMETRMNFEVLAERAARKLSDNPSVIELRKAETIKRLIQREDMLAKDRVEDNKRLIAVTEAIIEQIEKNVSHRPLIFTSMDKKFMRSAIDFTKRTLEGIAERDIAKDRKVTTQHYMRILDAQDKAIEELDKFKEQHASESEELEQSSYSGDPVEKHNRAQKKLAASEEGSKAIDDAAKKRSKVVTS